MDGGLVLYGERVMVPEALHRRTLPRLHDSHRALEESLLDLPACYILQPSQQQEPLVNNDNPTRPFESVSADFFAVAEKSLLIVTD
ncbi:hypothetical protein Pmani_004238 [Petrolisthes manimaculis]|uniref:Uncharacterized protein n=1 Tax=Petrolisthes manimaculis TaxID=1843537 RepID=A0AAE1UIM2_9EUCA|nr:hypothetical protein Pmani_004238 [Petrolisthes manimaculis]